MNSKEIVRRAIEFRKPERLPVKFRQLGMDDTHKVAWNQIGVGDRTKKKTYDEWGCVWERTEAKNMGLVTGHPLEDWSALDHYRWPDPHDHKFYEGMEERFEGSDGKYIYTDIFMLLFERMHSLRGFQNTLMDLYLEREKIEWLADRIVEFDIEIIKNISSRFPGQIDALTFSDDWGTQQNMFISPELWKEFFKPRYKKIFDVCKSAGWHIWMHSCGKINDIIPELIDIGVDVLNLEQPRLLGIEEIGNKFAGKICFLSGCDIQSTMPYADREAIREEARLLLNCWGTEDGGFIATMDAENEEDLQIPAWKTEVAEMAFLEFDRWKK